jgi:type IV secretion system protein VirB10
MLGIIFLTGQPNAPARPPQTGASVPLPSSDRVRDYQERLRMLDEQAARDAQQAAMEAASRPVSGEPPQGGSAPTDPLVEERRRREYESLFASNVVLSRRPESQQPDPNRRVTNTQPGREPVGREPSIDEVAEAVVRATARTADAFGVAAPKGPPQPPASAPADPGGNPSSPPVHQPTPAISPVGPLHRVLEGTVIDAVLTNRLDGSAAAPVNCLVTNALYSHSGQHVLIPAGARVLGETRAVQSLGQTRLAVAFHRLLMPDGSTVPLDQFRGLNQIGDSGLRDKVNHHFLSTFGAAGAVGLVTGLSQLLGSAGFGIGDGDRTVVIAGGVAGTTAQTSAQVMNRFLNRLPTITIREGHRVKVYITSDLDLTAWPPSSPPGSFERR